MPVLNIVLVEPQIPENTGNIARTCAVTGARLHLVRPLGFEVTDKHLKRAGLDSWHLLDITYYDNLDDFFAKNSGPFFYFTSKGRHRHTDVSYPDGSYLVFTAMTDETTLAAVEKPGIPLPILIGGAVAAVLLVILSILGHKHRKKRLTKKAEQERKRAEETENGWFY